MNPSHRYKERDLQQVVENLLRRLRLQLPDADIESAFVELALAPPIRAVLVHIRKMFNLERKKRVELLLNFVSNRLDRTPTYKDVTLILNEAGYTHTEQFSIHFMDMLKRQNGERWASAAVKNKKYFSIGDGELALWQALVKTYGIPSGDLGPMLLRLFVVMAATGKVSPLEVPYLTSGITDNDVKVYAQSMNFRVKKTPKLRA